MKNNIFVCPVLALMSVSVHADDNEAPVIDLAVSSQEEKLENMHVWGDKNLNQTLYVAPTTTVTAEQMEAINLTGVEDAIAYEPGLIVRRRFIGDANGVLGMRNSNMFQSTRSSVYADGVPLHYHLQTRWSGAPRWSLVAPDEVESIEVIYGPYSAAYSGNSMGGVVNIKTKVPTERTFIVQGALFNQFYEGLEREDDYTGARGSLTYGDKIGNLSILAFYNHLENNGQPQTHYYASAGALDEVVSASGAIRGVDDQGSDVFYYGDSGIEKSNTDLYKIKLTYDLDDYQFRFLTAYEDRDGENSPSSFITDDNGNTIWSGNVENAAGEYAGQTFTINGGRFSVGSSERESLLIGAGVSGPLGASDSWTFDLNVSDFRILKDVSLSSDLNPDDPDYTADGSVFEYDNTGWETFDFNIGTEQLLGRDDMTLAMGIHHSKYTLGNSNYDSSNYISEIKDSISSTSGGTTQTQAVFAQYGWQFATSWDVALGARYEEWEANDGYYGDEDAVVYHDDRKENGFSPKFSLGFAPAGDWNFRYSLARAIRFPIVEELYDNNRRTTSITTGDATLDPEVGLHNNFMIERRLSSGYVRLNVFYDRIDDAIYAHNAVIDDTDVNTFLGVDEMVAQGVEFILDTPRIINDKLSAKFNITYTDAEITKNEKNPDYVGNDFPRLPNWRSNLLLTWAQSDSLRLSGGIRYASNSYGELDNSDTASEVYGAQDDYFFINAKVDWNVSQKAKVALGMDNINNDVAYVAHPWPGRTVYLEGKYEF